MTPAESAPAAEDDELPTGVPPHVVAAAFSIFEQHLGRPASSTVEALAFAQRIV